MRCACASPRSWDASEDRHARTLHGTTSDRFMTTIAVVRKNGIAAIASDTLTKWGSAKESATYIANHEKILRVGENYLGITGSATFKLILRDYFGGSANDVRLNSTAEIF